MRTVLSVATVSRRRMSRHPTSRKQRSAIVVFAVAALLASFVSLAARSADAADTLLSQDRPVTVSSTESTMVAGSAAVDGDQATRWSSAYSNPQWIRVDLGATATISQVVLRWESAYATAYQIQTSDDGSSWATVYSTTTSTGGVQTLTVAGTGRYIRMYGTARATQWGFSLWEFQVYGSLTAVTACDTGANAALNRPATASSSQDAAFPASAAVDGDAGTRWSSAASDPQWLRVDLGSSQSVCQVVLSWESAYASSYQIEVSADGNAWTSVYSATTSTGGTQTLDVSGTGRYLRVYGTARATQWGYSLWELAVHIGGSSSGGDVLLSYNKPAVASSYQDDGACVGCTPAKAFDADPATRWATSATTGWVDPGWIYVDLGAQATVHQVVLQWDPAYATAYQIQVSNDTATWTNIYSTASGGGFRETLTVNGTGRYVRMYGTARSNGYGYSMWGFQVYGTGGNPTQPPALPPNVTFPAGRLVFGDEFNDAAGTTPSAARWKPEVGPGVNNELQYYTNNNNAATDGAGNLVMEARREVTAGSSCPGGPCQYTSARLNTSSSFTFTYGHVEARVKVSGTQGLWPAFWLLGANFSQVSWPACGEIDIMEHVGTVPNAVYSTLHAPAYFGGNGAGSPYTINGDFAAGFHTYAVDWDQSHMTFYVDGTAFFTVDKDTLETTRGPWVFDHPFFLILNNAVGGDWPGPPDATTVLPQRMLVDYVRVYQ